MPHRHQSGTTVGRGRRAAREDRLNPTCFSCPLAATHLSLPAARPPLPAGLQGGPPAPQLASSPCKRRPWALPLRRRCQPPRVRQGRWRRCAAAFVPRHPV